MAGLSWAAWALHALCACWPLLAAAQMESPLKGQGVPSLNTTKVFLSIRLERLLDVDDYKFKHENVATYWLSWTDPGAEAAIRTRTAEVASGPEACRRPCSNRVADVRCCDTIFLPSIYFTNADAFPEDREIGYSIDTTSNGAVVWESTVHALFYQPLSLRNYPRQSHNLEQQLTLTDTSRLVAGHPGLELVPSAVSVEGVHFARTSSDLTNGFSVHPRAALQLYRFNRSAWLQGRMTIAPHPSDVAPFTTLNSSTSGLLDETVQMAVFRFRAGRFFWSGQLNTNLPIFAVALMCVIVFWIPEDELTARIELCVALFLTLIAIQFVVSDRAVTRNDYVTQPQALILVTGSFILAVAFMSVLCYYICKWNTFKQRRRDMWQAARERSAQRKAAKAAAAAAASAVTQDSADEEETAKSFECLSMDKPEQPAIDCGEETGTQQAAQKAKCGCLSRKIRRTTPLPPRSDDYNAFLAWVVNKICMVFVVFSYLAAITFVAVVRGDGGLLAAPDALLPLSELSSCKVPGVLPGLADPCPAAPLAATEL